MPQGRTPSPELTALNEAVHRGEVLRDLLDTSLARLDPHPLVAPARVAPRPGELARAVLAWTALVFGVCYVALPSLAGALGLYQQVSSSLGASAFALLGLAGVTLLALRATRPEVLLPRDPRHAPRDPTLAAAAGLLLVWGVLHNLLPWVKPFAWMTGVELLTFLSFNVLEAALWGAMLASFTRSPGRAFGLGVAWQLGFFILWTVGLIVL